MKVKIGDKIYSSNDEPIMVILNAQDKVNIKDMDKDCTMYAAAPDNFFKSQEDFRNWMKK